MCHLLGSSRVINSIGVVAANGGLGEAAAWLVLRQSIYVSLTTNNPLNVNLDCYRTSSVFLGLTDHAWANKIVFIFAQTLLLSSRDGNAEDEGEEESLAQQWHAVRQSAMQWFQEKSDTFLPLYESPPRPPAPSPGATTVSTSAKSNSVNGTKSTDNDTADVSSPFPTVCMLQAPHVIGMMYYHLTQILLLLTSPSSPSSPGTSPTTAPHHHHHRASSNSLSRTNSRFSVPGGLALLHHIHITTSKIRSHLHLCLGLAQSNPSVVAANFEASHILFACGGVCLTNPDERRAAVSFLHDVRRRLGWGVDGIIARLEAEWNGTGPGTFTATEQEGV